MTTQATEYESAAEQLIGKLNAAETEIRRLRELMEAQADIISANLWHLPPEYSARNILLDVAVRLRQASGG